MNKFIFGLIIKIFLILPLIAFSAVQPGQVPTAGDIGVPESPVQDVPGLVNTLGAVVRWIYIIFFILAVAFILFAAFTYLQAGGDPNKVAEAKNRLIYAAVAIVIALLAVGFETIIRDFLTTGQESSAGPPPYLYPQPLPPEQYPL